MEPRLELIRPKGTTLLGRLSVLIRNIFSRTIADLSPALFTCLANVMAGAAQKVLVATARPLLDVREAVGCPVPAMWCSLKCVSEHEGTPNQNVLAFMPGGGFVARCPSAIPMAIALLPRLATLMGGLPPRMLILNYDLPAEQEGTITALEAAVKWASDQVDGGKVIVSGDSAGGHLALELARRSVATASSPIVGSVAICPWLDLTLSSHAWRENWLWDLLSKRWVRSGAQAWVSKRVASGVAPGEAMVASSPALLQEKDLASLLPDSVMMVAGQQDRLRDDAIAFAAKAPKGSVTLHMVDDGIMGTHDAMIFSSTEKIDMAFEEVALFCKRRFSGRSSSDQGTVCHLPSACKV
mmetsp:Transcript_76013/g.158524  ORF Transcript_76013/g.158524 Transcript_76013/m.158524 type:complete len:354 (-) Transcript_76013:219-1280(-)